jgi:hypothetical protein
LVFFEMTVHRVGEKAENQRKTREKSKVAENQVFWLDFCAKKKGCAYTSARGGRKTSKLLVVKHENNLGRLTEAAPQPPPPRKKKPREILVVKHEVDDLESEQQSEAEASPSPKKKKKRLLMADLLPRQLTCEVCYKAGLRIRIHFILIRIRNQHLRLNTNPDPDPIRIQGFNEKK